MHGKSYLILCHPLLEASFFSQTKERSKVRAISLLNDPGKGLKTQRKRWEFKVENFLLI